MEKIMEAKYRRMSPEEIREVFGGDPTEHEMANFFRALRKTRRQMRGRQPTESSKPVVPITWEEQMKTRGRERLDLDRTFQRIIQPVKQSFRNTDRRFRKIMRISGL